MKWCWRKACRLHRWCLRWIGNGDWVQGSRQRSKCHRRQYIASWNRMVGWMDGWMGWFSMQHVACSVQRAAEGRAECWLYRVQVFGVWTGWNGIVTSGRRLRGCCICEAAASATWCMLCLPCFELCLWWRRRAGSPPPRRRPDSVPVRPQWPHRRHTGAPAPSSWPGHGFTDWVRTTRHPPTHPALRITNNCTGAFRVRRVCFLFPGQYGLRLLTVAKACVRFRDGFSVEWLRSPGRHSRFPLRLTCCHQVPTWPPKEAT